MRRAARGAGAPINIDEYAHTIIIIAGRRCRLIRRHVAVCRATLIDTTPSTRIDLMSEVNRQLYVFYF